LVKIRKLLPHGKWLDWLKENFDLSERTARNYHDAAEYVARKSKTKSATVADFNALSPSLLYALAAGKYIAEEEAVILAATREGRVDATRAAAICQTLKTPVPPADNNDDDGADAEDAEKILDGPTPDVPPPAPIPPATNQALLRFDMVVKLFKEFVTKPAADFARTVHSADDLEKIECFIHAVRCHWRESETVASTEQRG
jgi:hypothetical protein